MGLRTYLPGLLKVLDVTCKYIRRNRDRIERFIGAENVPALDAVIVACEALQEVVLPLIPHGS